MREQGFPPRRLANRVRGFEPLAMAETPQWAFRDAAWDKLESVVPFFNCPSGGKQGQLEVH